MAIKMTQRQRILDYLDRFGSITPLDAFRDLGITKLATRVSEMRREGILIRGEMVTSKNRYGEDTTFMKYTKGEL